MQNFMFIVMTAHFFPHALNDVLHSLIESLLGSIIVDLYVYEKVL